MEKFKYLHYEFTVEPTNFCKFAACDFMLSSVKYQDSNKNIIEGLFNVVVEPVTKEQQNYISINVNIRDNLDRFQPKRDSKSSDQDVLLGRSIDRIWRTLLKSIGNYKITLNIQILKNYNGNKRLFCLIGSIIALKYIMPVNVGIYCDNNVIIAANKENIFAIEMESELLSYEEYYSRILSYVEKCLSLADHLKFIICKRLFNTKHINDIPKLGYNGENIYNFQSTNKLTDYEVMHIANKYVISQKKRIATTRTFHEIRPIEYKQLNTKDIVFSRGDTVALSNVMNSKESNEELISNYFFHSYSIGESTNKSSNRREIGHGNLIRKAFQNVVNSNHNLKLNAHILSSNGSSSMASVCAHSINLQLKGFLNEAIYGISIGGFEYGSKYTFAVDINAQEDMVSFMDFKIAGTSNYITAIQMDSKSSLKIARLKKLLDLAKKSIKFIHNTIGNIIDKNKLIEIYEIHKNKIGSLIGLNGEHIKLLRDYLDCKIYNTQLNAAQFSVFYVQGGDIDLRKYAFKFFGNKIENNDTIAFILKDKTEYKDNTTKFPTSNGIWISDQKLQFVKYDFIVAKVMNIQENRIKIVKNLCKLKKDIKEIEILESNEIN